MHLTALERSERNGPLLTADEYVFFDPHGESIVLGGGGGLLHQHQGGHHTYAGTPGALSVVHNLQSGVIGTGPAGIGRLGSSFEHRSSAVARRRHSTLPGAISWAPGEFRGGGSGAVRTLETGGMLGGDLSSVAVPADFAHFCSMDEPRHVLDWNAWIQRQRARGWFTSEALYHMTVLGALVGASNFTTFWSQLQIWKSSMFFFPFVLYVLIIGLPAIQTEVSEETAEERGNRELGTTAVRGALRFFSLLWLSKNPGATLRNIPSFAVSCTPIVFSISLQMR